MNQSFMKEKPVFPLLLSMALPMVISMLVNSLYNIVDSFFVAQISEDAMTALSLVFPVQNFNNAAAIGFGIGISSQISISLGGTWTYVICPSWSTADSRMHPDHAWISWTVYIRFQCNPAGLPLFHYRLSFCHCHHFESCL